MAFTSSQLARLYKNPTADLPLYAASKAALNMLTRGLVPLTEAEGITLLSLHPGWVQTELGGSQAPLSIEQSARRLAQVIDNYSGRIGHHFIDDAGNRVAW